MGVFIAAIKCFLTIAAVELLFFAFVFMVVDIGIKASVLVVVAFKEQLARFTDDGVNKNGK